MRVVARRVFQFETAGHNIMIIGRKVKLRQKKLSDARSDYKWQTDTELLRLDAMPALTASFPQYLQGYTSELRRPAPTRHIFAVETVGGEHIGNCVYYNVDEAKGEVELGIMIGNRDYWGDGYGVDAVTVLVNHIFRRTKIRRVYLKTLDWNQRAQKCFLKCSFTPCGHMVKGRYSFVLMELYRLQWETGPMERVK